MALFKQSSEARAVMIAAAQERIAESLLSRPSKEIASERGVSTRTVDRWKAWLRGERGPHKARNPFKQSVQTVVKAATQGASLSGNPRLTLHVTMTMNIGGDEAYRVERDTSVDLDEDFLEQALNHPDEAWETFFDEYGINPGIIVDANLYFEE